MTMRAALLTGLALLWVGVGLAAWMFLGLLVDDCVHVADCNDLAAAQLIVLKLGGALAIGAVAATIALWTARARAA